VAFELSRACTTQLLDPGDRAAVPFAPALYRLIEEARSRLHARCKNSSDSLSPNAHAILERSLLRTLSEICGQVIELGYSLFRFRHELFRVSSRESTPSYELYDSFVEEICEGGLGRFFTEYPALERLVTVCTDQWVTAVGEFLERLQADRVNISTFFCNNDPGAVVGVETDLSDRHDGGRSVIALQFASGLRLVYKPKDLRSEEVYSSILTWLNQNGAPLDFRTLRILKRDGYGWAEFVEQRPCQDAEEARRYYQRAGQLLCVIYLLGGADCHFDNVIAAGEHPTLVDTEMLFQPTLACEGAGEKGSVLRTGLLPRPSAEDCDFSGLGCVSDQKTRFRIPEWKEANSDALTLCFRTATVHPSSNVPMLGHTPLSPVDYVAPIIKGFREMYLCMLSHRKQLLEPEGPLAGIAGQKVRILARGTPEYYLALSQALHPKLLRIAGCPEIKLQNNSRFPLLEPFEVEALRQMNVPRFLVEASAKTLVTASEGEVCACFAQSGLEHVLSEIKNLSEDHLEQQVKLIEFSLAISGLARISDC
jgi:type 2 lantibiotic biosynthesis protein LanM